MLNKEEAGSILIVSLVLGMVFSLMESFTLFLFTALIIFTAILINIAAKHVMSHYLATEIETKLWTFSRYGFTPSQKFSKPMPAGIFAPILTTFITLGMLRWMACLVFEVKAKTHKVAKKYGLYSFSEVTELEMGLIAAAGILGNLLFAIIGYLIGPIAGFPSGASFVQLNLYYAFFQIIPFSDLDGMKLYFASRPLWVFISSLTLIGLVYALRISI